MPINQFDKAARFAAKLDAEQFLAWVLGLPSEQLGFGGWLDTRAVPLPHEQDQIGDTVARLNLGGHELPWAVAVEFQIEPDPLMFGRLLAYLAQIWQTLKPDPERGSRFQVGAAVLNLTGTGQASRQMRLAGTPLVTHLAVVERNLATESADDTVSKIERGELGWAVLPWLPLMSGGADEKIIERWKSRVLLEPESRRRSDCTVLALTFAEAADCRPQWELALKGWNMRESVVLTRFINEGRTEGRAEGRLEERASAIITVLEQRFGAVPEEAANAIRACSDLAKLQEWLTASVHAESLDAFRATTGV
jgi:hypothetical protein